MSSNKPLSISTFLPYLLVYILAIEFFKMSPKALHADENSNHCTVTAKVVGVSLARQGFCLMFLTWMQSDGGWAWRHLQGSMVDAG